MAGKTAAPKMSKAEYQALWLKAQEAGHEAAAAATPTPMIVGTPTHPLGSDIDPSKKIYYVAGGVCGFAWVNIRPATSGLVRWLRSENIGHKSYYGGWDIWAGRVGGQSMEIKEAWASGVAKVLTEAGFTAYSQSRMD